MLPSLDTLAAMASAAAAEAAAAVQERDRVPDPVLGWNGDGEAMRVSMPGALIKSTDGTRFFTVPIANAVKRNADGVKIRVGDWDVRQRRHLELLLDACARAHSSRAQQLRRHRQAAG